MNADSTTLRWTRCWSLDEWLPGSTPGELPALLRRTCSSMNSGLSLEA
ncbi:hypothetical protein PUR57_20990 [Streptomyces sp. JV176]|nr:hypothetical protein [Streptomyces sp. JV176]MEE1801126.1 hypothetical protein [Streptomyces sp. JV176]